MNRETKKLVIETAYQCVSKKYPFLKENEKFNIVKRIITTEGFFNIFQTQPKVNYNQFLSEGLDSIESIKSVCKSGLDKLSKNMKKLGINPNRDNNIISIVKSAKSDEEIKAAIDKLVKEKMYYKDTNDNTRIGASEAGWITYSLNRQAGRGILSSFILAMCVLTRMFVFKIIRQNKMSRLNKYIRKTAKHPVLFTLGAFVSWIVGFLLVQIFAGTVLFSMAHFIGKGNLNATIILFGIGVSVNFILKLMMLLWVVLNSILVFLNLKRDNTDKDIVVA